MRGASACRASCKPHGDKRLAIVETLDDRAAPEACSSCAATMSSIWFLSGAEGASVIESGILPAAAKTAGEDQSRAMNRIIHRPRSRACCSSLDRQPHGGIAPPRATAAATPAGGLSIDFTGSGLFTDRMMQIVALITMLSLAPSILIMMTSFVRIVVVLSLLRTAMGLQQSPPNSVIVSLSLFLTLFVMTPTLTDAYHAGHRAADRTTRSRPNRRSTAPCAPMKIFMLAPCARRRPEAVHGHGARQARQSAGSDRDHHAGAGLHALGAEARVRDRLPDLRAVPHHRHGGRLDPDVAWA